METKTISQLIAEYEKTAEQSKKELVEIKALLVVNFGGESEEKAHRILDGNEKHVYEMLFKVLSHFIIPENGDLKQLLESRKKYERWSTADLQFDKLEGSDTDPGRKIKIIWDDYGDDFPDHGYLFELPGLSAPDESDIFVHIPKPQNPNGIGDADPVFLHLYDILTNKRVISVTVVE